MTAEHGYTYRNVYMAAEGWELSAKKVLDGVRDERQLTRTEALAAAEQARRAARFINHLAETLELEVLDG